MSKNYVFDFIVWYVVAMKMIYVIAYFNNWFYVYSFINLDVDQVKDRKKIIKRCPKINFIFYIAYLIFLEVKNIMVLNATVYLLS